MLATKATCYLREVKKAGRGVQSGIKIFTEQCYYTNQTYVPW
jgi:hypothetical protein